ncbi:hypothetical protein P175DRAFT_0120762 [Aspergillus ochraceoroseus IBT 24754]|uniref:Uncharacterized protein n=1 Tax=Aspergillus ochraceoroseus IBT 24754 TaxID=1392256 RepID=A0A2T5LKZ7_9EURO|nr:uncharacterized protein P175DRAFT_0120762 [Aspergillus ochraceoroseus IBT 24754]PTU16954.1 hypothetical protein P175DRAFT_0120762 [Aspergillus ochraceoroseus IBT 24754]
MIEIVHCFQHNFFAICISDVRSPLFPAATRSFLALVPILHLFLTLIVNSLGLLPLPPSLPLKLHIWRLWSRFVLLVFFFFFFF